VSEELAAKVAEAVKKYDAGEELTDYEWTLLAYTVFASGCSVCGTR